RRHLAGIAGSGTSEVVVTRVVHTYVHLTPDSPVAEVEAGNTLAPVERVAEWCRTAGTKVIIRPVLDLATHYSRDGYVPTETMREQAILINRTCVHPWCDRPARACDLDHITPYENQGPPGQTSSANLAPLCRHHHRLKTHSGWQYQHLEPGIYLWTSPAGRAYLRTPTGTTTLNNIDSPAASRGVA
ncbi:HNH endonuclease signature motif containing protein, partial [Nocardioides sp.]|uniref:HNH endonuclease signature motif containing protein n=1 Tax=Nocardioides sp. TaxID=35761 RepID=UPI003454EED5